LLNHGSRLIVRKRENPGAEMNYRKYVAATVVVASSLLASPAVYAATSVNSPVMAMFGKSKMIKVTFMNDSGSPMEVKAGEDVIKLEAGKPVTVSLTPGTRIVSTTDTTTQKAGSLIAEANNSLNGATIHIK
jgi:phosphosulfolactate phosphohydrolase-like enzyme